MSEIAADESPRPPSVFFIDDSATMREVMKIAFRRENIGVVTCHNATTALAQIEQDPPDVVITDVIMPDKNGFEVCEFIKQHHRLQNTPVVLLSGVVNREVANRAFSVKADELIRKPFQPQDLIARVKQLLAPKKPAAVAHPGPLAPAPGGGGAPGVVLSGIFGNAPVPARSVVPPLAPPAATAAQLHPSFTGPAIRPPGRNGSGDPTKLRLEVLRLENLVKKLQSELTAERDYSRALEAHVKTLQEND